MTSKSDRREIFIHEMGLGPVWKKRDKNPGQAKSDDAIDKAGSYAEPATLSTDTLVPTAPASSFFSEAVSVPSVTALQGTAPSAEEVAGMDWDLLKENVAGCIKCRLCQTRTKTVFGVGDEKAKWLFVGEGPGRNEDARGEPFVGPAGKLLDNMLLSLGLRRGENAYIANTVKCRPIGEDGRDRPPAPDEATACLPYLERQIALINPTIIVALGKSAALSLLKLPSDTPVASLRGKVHQYHDLPLVVTYHPAYLLRKLTEKGKAWNDLCLAMNTYASAP